MKKQSIFLSLSIIFFLALAATLNAQEKDCKVLMKSISGTYSGGCKKGLANGYGKAQGTDSYEGQFKKGWPNGTGTYKWSTGETYTGDWINGVRDGKGKYVSNAQGRDSVLSGYWKHDKYVGEKPFQSYVIEYRNSIGRVSCIRVGDRPYIRYVFSRNGEPSNQLIGGLLLQGSSGSEKTSTSFTGYEQVTFPFSGKVTFTAPNAWMSATLHCELRLTINEPGSWVVTMFF